MGPLKEQIYMMDIQIHDIHLESVKELECLDNQQEFKIYAHFLNFDPVLVYNKICMDSKASPILFKMNPEELIKAIDRSPLSLSVAGMLDKNREYTVGTVKVYFTESFAEAITLGTSSVIYPVVAELDETFKFRNLYHEESGDLMVNLKLNCLGDIDIKQLGICDKDKKESADQDFETNEECVNKNDNQLLPEITDMEHVAPATTITNNNEGMRLPIPWTLDLDRQLDQCDPCEMFVDVNAENNVQTTELVVKCTCDSLPDFVSSKAPQSINLKCQCAEILAAMKSCFPNAIPSAEHTQSLGMPLSPINDPTIAPVGTSNDNQTTSVPEPQRNNPEPYTVNSAAQPPLQQPVSSVEAVTAPSNHVDNKSTVQQEISPVVKSASEENFQVTHKLEAKNAASNIEVNIPETKTEESSKKIQGLNEPTWKERKQNIKKEYRKKRKTPKDIYEYTAGMYPGMVVGHKHCIPVIRMVPRNMGWMWNLIGLFSNTMDLSNQPDCHCRLNQRCLNVNVKKTNKGWRPGAMLKTVAENFGSWNKAAGFKEGDDVESFLNLKKKKGAKDNALNKSKKAEDEKKCDSKFKPTLHVHKKDKFYYITMTPPGIDPNVKPITFKVDPRKGSSDEETSSDSTSDDSFEFEYTVPAGLIPPPKVVRKATEVTQYDPLDYLPKPKKGELATDKCKELAETNPTERKSLDAKKGKQKNNGKKPNQKGKKK